jgi:hypothetical protein
MFLFACGSDTPEVDYKNMTFDEIVNDSTGLKSPVYNYDPSTMEKINESPCPDSCTHKTIRDFPSFEKLKVKSTNGGYSFSPVRDTYIALQKNGSNLRSFVIGRMDDVVTRNNTYLVHKKLNEVVKSNYIAKNYDINMVVLDEVVVGQFEYYVFTQDDNRCFVINETIYCLQKPIRDESIFAQTIEQEMKESDPPPPLCEDIKEWPIGQAQTATEISRKSGNTLGLLQKLNPGVNLDKLEAGKKLNYCADN